MTALSMAGRIPTADEHAACARVLQAPGTQLTHNEMLTLRVVVAGHTTGATIHGSTLDRARRIVSELDGGLNTSRRTPPETAA